MIEVPTVDGLDVALGNAKHLPKRERIPKEFWDRDNAFNELASLWFFSGLEANVLAAKQGVTQSAAMAAIAAILRSFDPSHEHKIAGTAYLISEWFEIRKPKAAKGKKKKNQRHA